MGGLERFDACALAYCLMGNHYHFVLHTRQGGLSRLMRHVNGVYTQAFNRRHGLVGHLFQGRFKAILVDREAYLLEVCRYVELNPVRARMVAAPADWAWSSYGAHVGHTPPPAWLDTAALHARLMGHTATHAGQARQAARRYAELVASGLGVRLWDEALNRQIYLGDDAFVERMQQQRDESPPRGAAEVPRPQRTAPGSLQAWLKACGGNRAQALRQAYTQSGLTMTALAAELGVTTARVSQLIAQAEREQQSAEPQARADANAAPRAPARTRAARRGPSS